MEGERSILTIRMFGGFFAVYGDQPVSFGRNLDSRRMKLLRLLIFYGKNGVAREYIIKELYGQEKITDIANHLRVTIHRVKKLLKDAGLPTGEYIVSKKGIYYWKPPMEMNIDVRDFEKFFQEAECTEKEEEKILLLQRVCKIYKGEFLADIEGGEWISQQAAYYKMLYTKALTKLCDMLMKNEAYREVLDYSGHACELYPFDEWQAVRIECYLAMNQYNEAMEEYESTAKLFFEEMGMNPSSKMLEQFERMGNRMIDNTSMISEIENRLKESEVEKGAFYCSMPGFRDSYRLISRMSERSEVSAYLMVCRLIGKEGQLLEKDTKQEKMSAVLKEAIGNNLRRGDCYTRCHPSEFLILLTGICETDCNMIFERIRRYFSKNHPSWDGNLNYLLTKINKYEMKG